MDLCTSPTRRAAASGGSSTPAADGAPALTGTPSAARSALRLLVRGLRGGGERAAARHTSPRRRVRVERAGIVAAPQRVAAYLRATQPNGAGDGDYGDGLDVSPGAAIPPLYPAVWETALTLELFGAADIPFPRAGLVHLGGETVQLRPLRIGEPIRCRVELDRMELTTKGVRLALSCRNWNAAEMLCTEDRIELLVRGRASGERSPRPSRPDDEEELEWVSVREWEIGASHGRRYARASGDYNPIHLWSWTARPFGFASPILHGFCMEAMVAHALIRDRMGGVPAALRRLEVSFRSPLPLPARVRLLAADGAQGGRFRLLREDGTRPAAEGAWVGRSPLATGERQG